MNGKALRAIIYINSNIEVLFFVLFYMFCFYRGKDKFLIDLYFFKQTKYLSQNQKNCSVPQLNVKKISNKFRPCSYFLKEILNKNSTFVQCKNILGKAQIALNLKSRSSYSFNKKLSNSSLKN